MNELWFRLKEVWEEGAFLKILLGGVVFVVGGIIIWVIFFNNSNPSTTTLAPITTEKQETIATISSRTQLSGQNRPYVFGIESALELHEKIRGALREAGPTAGLEESLEFDKSVPDADLTATNLFVQHIEYLRIMRNYASIGVIALMAESTDKVRVLDSLEKNISLQVETGKQKMQELQEEIRYLKSEGAVHDRLRKEAESKTLEGFENFDAKLMYESLLLSIEAQGVTSELSNKIKLLERFIGVYKKLTDYLTIKLRFIVSNREALIKGVSVVQVRGSDEDLILTEAEWRKAIGQ